MNDREKNIIALAFGYLERAIDDSSCKLVGWEPPLTMSEVARLRRRLTRRDRRVRPVAADGRVIEL